MAGSAEGDQVFGLINHKGHHIGPLGLLRRLGGEEGIVKLAYWYQGLKADTGTLGEAERFHGDEIGGDGSPGAGQATMVKES